MGLVRLMPEPVERGNTKSGFTLPVLRGLAS
jgi:hypothetical protein